MIRTCVIASCFVLVILAGVVHGLWTDRWGVPPEIDEAAERLPNLAKTLWGWHSTDFPIDQRQLERGGVAGYVARRYVNPEKNTTATVVLVCGRSGHVAAHTPDVCFGGAGYEEDSPREHQEIKDEISGQTGKFWVSRFSKKQGPIPAQLRLFYAWKGSGAWEAPANPRLVFAGRTLLYKLYVQRELQASGKEPLEEDPCLDLIQRLLPALEAVTSKQ
jgi:hypothetical protein